MTDPNTKLTPHFTVAEMTRSTSHPEIYNVPAPGVVDNLTRVCQWLEKMRDKYNHLYPSADGKDQPVKISSGYRSERLNRAVGGTKESNHLTGCAADIICKDCAQAIHYAAILMSEFDFAHKDWDEIIIEKKFLHFWLHFAVRANCNRRKVTIIETKR